jgi:hypothetical protein
MNASSPCQVCTEQLGGERFFHEDRGVEKRDVKKFYCQRREKFPATPNDQMQWSADRRRQTDKLVDMPFCSACPARSCRKLKRDMGHFWPRSDVLCPTFPSRSVRALT